MSAPDHLEWAQVRPRNELRDELKAKFAQLLARIPETGNRADAYAQISVIAARLGADGPYDTTDYQAHNAWAVRAIVDGHLQWLSTEMNARLDRPGLFRQPDDWCNANGPDAANEQKYARVSMLLARLAARRGVTWDWPGQGSLDPFGHLRWARLHPLHELLGELEAKISQLCTKSPTAEAAADAYAQATMALIELGADGPADVADYQAHYGWALSAQRDWLVSESRIRLHRQHCFVSPGAR